jgi:hypothetical protein
LSSREFDERAVSGVHSVEGPDGDDMAQGALPCLLQGPIR